MMRALALLAVLMLSACAAPRQTAPPADVTGTTVPPAVVDEEPVEGKIPDGIVPLTKEQEDAVSKPN